MVQVVQELYDRMSEAASLNPDPMDLGEDDEDDDAMFAGVDPSNRLQMFEAMLNNDDYNGDGRFDDADGDEPM